MTPQEKMLYDKLMDTHQKAKQWLAVCYLLVAKYGENYKLVIPEANKIKIPTFENPIQFDYNTETDTLTIEIVEEPEKRIITV